MNKEKMLEVAKILFLNEVPKEQAKYIGSFIEEQNKEIERLKEIQSKIDKAIGYIKRCRDYHKTYHNEDKMFPDELTSLEMILQGDENND